jgi:iron-regulated transporter 1
MFPEIFSMIYVYRHIPALQSPKIDDEFKVQNIVSVFVSGWRTYMNQGVFLCSLAFIFLFITVLHNGALMLSYLVSVGLSNTSVAIFYAACAVGGVTATFVTPAVITRFKVIYGGLYSIWFQITCLTIGTVLLAVYTFMDKKEGVCDLYCWVCIGAFMTSIIVSRFGLFGFDLAEIQIMQTYVAESDRGTVNATEKSLTKIAELIIYLFAVVLSKPSQFFYLALVSTGCVLSAAVIYTVWTRTRFAKDIQLEQQTGTEENLQQDEIVLDDIGLLHDNEQTGQDKFE